MTHLTRREQQADGTWVKKCTCGWQSQPAAYRELLGWACPVGDAEPKREPRWAERVSKDEFNGFRPYGTN